MMTEEAFQNKISKQNEYVQIINYILSIEVIAHPISRTHVKNLKNDLSALKENTQRSSKTTLPEV